MCCQPLWTILCEISGLNCCPLEQAPIDRLWFRFFCSVQFVHLCALTFRVYHGLKNDCIPIVLAAYASKDCGEVIMTSQRLAKFHWSEIRDTRQRGAGGAKFCVLVPVSDKFGLIPCVCVQIH